jgi:hypothetical protein
MSLKFTDGTEQPVFSGPTTTITAAYSSAARAEIELKARAQLIIDVDYTKGAETSIELQIELSPVVTYPIAVPATGVDYYKLSQADSSGNVTFLEYSFTVTAADKLRVPLPVLHQERIMRLSVKRTGGADATAGTVKLRVVDDSHPVTSHLTGRQP